MPAGRTIPFTPIPGAVGFITIQGVSLNLTKFEPKVKGDPIDASNFNSPVDPINGVLHREWLIGAVDGEYVMTGLRDQSLIGWNPMPGDSGPAHLYYSEELGFTIEYLVTDMGGGQDATKAGEFACTVKANGLIDFFGRTNLGANIDDLGSPATV